MDKTRKKNIKRIIALVCIVAVVVLLAAMPLMARQEPESDGPQASILSGTVGTGSIARELIGGGMLAEEDAEVISVPSSVKITEFLVSNGDEVKEGDPIATVDRVTVMTAIAEVQETLEYLAEEIEAESDEDTDGEVEALAGGTVKILYAQEGDFVQDVMLEYGALAVLSLDGLMAVDLTTDAKLAVGDTVAVTLSDGTVLDGRVASNLAGEMTVTVKDDDFVVGETVQISGEDGTLLGPGELYIYTPWNATAYSGTVDSIEVSEGETVDTGDTLMELSDMGSSALYRQLVAQRQEYEELMLELFGMYQTLQLTAPCDGVVSGIDKDSPQLLADSGETYGIVLLANAPNGDDETQYTNFIGQVSAVNADGLVLQLNPAPVSVTDYKDLTAIPTDTTAMTQTVSYTAQAPVYALSGGEWVQISGVNPGDILLFACDESGSFVWVVRVIAAATQPETPTEPTVPTEPSTPTEPTEPADPTEPAAPTDPSTPTEPTTPVNPGTSVMPGITYPSTGAWGGMGGYYQGGTAEEEFELYGLDTADIAAVTPQNTMTLDITVDELDITSLQIGMAAQIQLDALGGEKFEAVITDISNTGTNNGGNSKFTVELTLARSENMLVGMTATATIILETAKNILTLPAAALVEEGTQTLVYTGYDAENGVLTDPVPVTVGLSDGENVEILGGVGSGVPYYYAYYDTLEVSYTPDFGSGFPFGG